MLLRLLHLPEIGPKFETFVQKTKVKRQMKDEEKKESISLKEISVKPLNGYRVCVTGVTSKEETRAIRCIKALGGEFFTDLHRDTSCLLVKKVGSKKYQASFDLSIPRVQLQWLSDCYTTESLLPMDRLQRPQFKYS